MRVVSLHIKNFRCVRNAKLIFNGHALLVGMNNVGKSTICEALELVLGLDRLKRFPPVEEFDFYNSRYLDSSVEPAAPIPIEIEVTLTDLPDELANKCFDKLEHWYVPENRVLGPGELELADSAQCCECLRVKTIASYNIEEDEFQATCVFCNGPSKPDGSPMEVPRVVRQMFGFFYLRALRTGSRALSLERGSLLDIILQRRNVRTGIWENTIEQLRNLTPPIDEGAVDLSPILENIEKRLAQYIPLTADRSTKLYVSQLTREHLRQTISFFLRISSDQEPVPFREVGSGTLNVLVLALLSFIAELKKDNVIFAMEEPEIALPPYTQRRITNYLLENSSQCFITSHSPYIIERFEPDQVYVLRKDTNAVLSATKPPVGATLKGKTYRRHARKGLAEAMLGRGVIICEGVTEKDIICAATNKMEEADPAKHYPLDLSGVAVISVDGDGALCEFGAFFKALQVTTYAFYDKKTRTADEEQKLAISFDTPYETPHKGSEAMLVEEVPTARLWQFLQHLKKSGEKPNLLVPASIGAQNEIKDLVRSVLQKEKGSGYAGRLIDLCTADELPTTVVAFLEKVYSTFKKPDPVPPVDSIGEEAAAAVATGGTAITFQ